MCYTFQVLTSHVPEFWGAHACIFKRLGHIFYSVYCMWLVQFSCYVQMHFVVLQCYVQYNHRFHKIHGNLNGRVTIYYFWGMVMFVQCNNALPHKKGKGRSNI